MKAGDTISFTGGSPEFNKAYKRIMKSDPPKKGEHGTCVSVLGTGIIVKEYPLLDSLAWKFESWVPVQSKGMSTHASRRLTSLFEERDGVPEFHPDEKQYLPEEKVFTEEEDF